LPARFHIGLVGSRKPLVASRLGGVAGVAEFGWRVLLEYGLEGFKDIRLHDRNDCTPTQAGVSLPISAFIIAIASAGP
jgi:hypothetical protein